MESVFSEVVALRPDSLFSFVLVVSIFLFVAAEVFWVFKKSARPESLRVPAQHLEIVWSLIPALVLLLLTFVYQKIPLVARGM